MEEDGGKESRPFVVVVVVVAAVDALDRDSQCLSTFPAC